MMDLDRVRPKDMPKLRSRFISDWKETEEDNHYGFYLGAWGYDPFGAWTYDRGRLWQGWEAESDVPLWFVGADMAKIAADAASTMDPNDGVWTPTGPNSGIRSRHFDCGFAFIEGGLTIQSGEYDHSFTIHTIFWYNYKGALVMTTGSHYRHQRRVYSYANMMGDGHSHRPDEPYGGCVPDRDYGFMYAPLREVFSFLAAMWFLSDQPTVATATTKQVAGPKIKGQRRRQPPSDVKIVELRQMRHENVTHSPSGRRYTHRWVVRGHWRDQACGPGLKERRRVWVPAYTKGPADAPLIEKETVFAWRR